MPGGEALGQAGVVKVSSLRPGPEGTPTAESQTQTLSCTEARKLQNQPSLMFTVMLRIECGQSKAKWLHCGSKGNGSSLGSGAAPGGAAQGGSVQGSGGF